MILSRFPTRLRTLGLAVLCVVSPTVFGQAHPPPEYEGPLLDAWLDGKIEVAYMFNRYLNPFEIGTRVDDSVVVLTGTVASNVQRVLAGDIARSVEGVRRVENQLVVDPSAPGTTDPISHAFVQTVEDATTTAVVKSRLLANEETAGLATDVDTQNHVVTLSGHVRSEREKLLAGTIAEEVPDVSVVNNRLEITSH